jgi:quercetin 2,3-dioxygenase
MITVRRSKERKNDLRRKHDLWLTFFPTEHTDAVSKSYGALEMLNEDHLSPGATVPRHKHRDIELITYVREGALAYEDSMGRSGIIHTGEFQRLTAGSGIHHSERNASSSEWAHIFQMWLRPGQAGLDPEQEQKRFSVAQRRSRLCIFASPDGRRGSLRIHQDAFLYSALLNPGQHIIHELAHDRSAWVHIVRGAAKFGDLVLTTGDGIGITAERAVSLTALEETEIMLFNLETQAAQIVADLPEEVAGGIILAGGLISVRDEQSRDKPHH